MVKTKKKIILRVLVIQEDVQMRHVTWMMDCDCLTVNLIIEGGAVVIDWEGMFGLYSDYN